MVDTAPEATERLHEYWVHGKGAAKIAWGTPGDFSRCVAELGKYIDNADGYCNLAHHAALGIWPAQHAAELKGRSAMATAAKPYGDVTYADPKNGKYPVDTHDHAKAAWSFINMPKNAGEYPMNGVTLSEVKDRIMAACKKFGIDCSDDGDDSGSSSRSSSPYFRSFPLEDISIRAGGDGRTVTAYAAVFNTPGEVNDQDGHYMEELDPACFNRAISDAKPQGSRAGWRMGVFYNHGMTIWGTPSERHSMPIGVPLEVKADQRGILTVTRYNKSELADEVLENIREGSIPGYSFTGVFRRSNPLIPRGGFRKDRNGNLPVVRRTESTLKEYGPTPFPVYAGAEVMGVRAESILGAMAADPDLAMRMLSMFRDSAPDGDSLSSSGAPETGLATEDSRPRARSGRSVKEEIQAARSEFLPALPEVAVTAVDDRPATAGAGDDAARVRQDSLRGQYRNLQDMEARQRAIIGELAGIDALTEPGEDDLSWQGTLITEHDDLDALAAPLRKRAADMARVRAAYAEPANREEPPRTPDLQTRNFAGQDPFRDMERIRANLVEPHEVRGRALDAIELSSKRGDLGHDFAENATHMSENQFMGQSNVAKHILETGSQEYVDSFRAYLGDPVRESRRAALSLTSANGGYLLPFILDPTIILTNSGSANPWRRISNIKQTTSNTWNGVNSAGVNAAWLAEATIVTDGSPTVGNIVVTPVKAAAWVYGSYEVLEDTDFGQQLPRLLADAKDRLEEAAFATGGGSTVPNGVVPGATTVYTTATTTVIALADVYGVQGALPPRFRNAPGCAWVANVAIINKIRQLDTAGGASFWTNLGKGQPETLLGAPIYESTTMTSSVATTSLMAIFGDFGQFIIVDRVGVSMIYDPLVQGTGGILPTGQAGWFMFWRTGSQLSTVNAFRVMKGL